MEFFKGLEPLTDRVVLYGILVYFMLKDREISKAMKDSLEGLRLAVEKLTTVIQERVK